jgi:hypothetical protein
MKLEIPPQIFGKYTNIKFNGNPELEPSFSMLSDRHKEANSYFSLFCEFWEFQLGAVLHSFRTRRCGRPDKQTMFSALTALSYTPWNA